MNWYKSIRSIIKIAGPKEKIQKYGITDPALQMFVMRYEGMIKWNGYTVENEETGQDVNKTITNQKDINEFITTQILPKVFAKADPENPNNNFIKKFDVEKEYLAARQNNIFNPELEHAYNISKTDKEAGEKYYLNVINSIKKQGFDNWINYLKTNPDYLASPSFVYMLLNSILDSSSAKTVNPPPNCSPPVVAQIFHKVRQYKIKYDGPIKDEKIFKNILALSKEGKTVDQISQETGIPVDHVQGVIDQNNSRNLDIFKTYEKDLVDHGLKSAQNNVAVNKEEGWIQFPRKDKTQPKISADGKEMSAEEVFEENLKALDSLSVPNAWCTTINWNGRPYLTRGDFFAYIVRGRAGVGIRFEGEDIAEIAGNQNTENGVMMSCPRKYWKEVIKFISERNLEDKIKGFAARYHWEELLKEKKLNQSFFNPDGSPNMEEVEEFCSLIEKNPELYSRVEDERFNAFPEVIERFKVSCKRGWFAKLQQMQGADAMKIAEEVATNAAKMPEFVLADPAFIQNVHRRLTVIYQNNPEQIEQVIKKVPNHLQIYPQGKEVFKEAIIRRYNEGLYWEANVYGASRKPKTDREKIKVAKLSLTQLQEVMGKYAPEFNEDKNFELEIETAKQQSAGLAISKGWFSQEMPKQQVEQYFNNPENIDKIAEDYAERIINAYKTPYKRQTEETVFKNDFMLKEINAIAPGWIRNLPGFQSLSKKIKDKVLRSNIKHFTKFDDEYRQDPELYNLYKQHTLQNNPIKHKLTKGDDIFDPRLKEDAEFQAAVGNYEGNIEQVLKTIKFKPSTFLSLPPHVQSMEQIKNAYLAARVFTGFAPSYNLLSREFPMLPNDIKNMPEVKEKYIQICANLIRVALPGSPSYLDCKNIDPLVADDPRISEACAARANKGNKNACSGWYVKQGIFSV